MKRAIGLEHLTLLAARARRAVRLLAG